jgi:endo-1,4-beta-xylanase
MAKRKKLQKKKYLPAVLLLVAFLILAGGVLAWPKQTDTPILPTPSLKALASARGISLGNFAIHNHLSVKAYTDILSSQFDFVLADNTPNWYFTDGGLRPSRETYNYKQMDEIVAFAEARGMPVEAHHYVWGEQKWLPDWLKNGGYSKQEVLDIMREHIMTVGSNYSGKIAQWTVVNEAFTRQRHLYNLRDWWADNTGGLDYIDSAFYWAREADPNSKLILNDFDNESINDTSNMMYEYLSSAKARGVPIDGIGMQMHLDGVHPPQKDEVISNMKRFAGLGLEIYVTEFDVNMDNVKADAASKDKIQENIYYEMMRACIESEVCHNFAYLGITDAETWYKHIGLKDPRPLMFDEDYNPKPAFWGTRTALTEY